MEDYLQNLDSGQKEAVTSEAKRILCLAGAGSGKTRVLTSRILDLVWRKKVRPENILAITFTRNAALEMAERLAATGIATDKMWTRTFHSAGYAMIRELGQELGKKVVDEGESAKFFEMAFQRRRSKLAFGRKWREFVEETNWPEYLLWAEIFQVIGEIKTRSLKWAQIAADLAEAPEGVANFYDLAEELMIEYEKYMEERGRMDFSDLINQILGILRQDKSVRARFQERFQHILVDEYQDVNYGQVKLLELLIGQQGSLFVVGDDWQAIYGWRGGEIRYILDFEKSWKGAEKVCLPYNYRSSGVIVRSASGFIKKNKDQYGKKVKAYGPKGEKVEVWLAAKGDRPKLVVEKIKALLREGMVEEEEVMIIGRYWKHLKEYQEQLEVEGLEKVETNTIHGAKGREAEVVFVVEMISGRGGFPNIKEDPEIYRVIRPVSPREKLEEERRCFYVAVTRAKKKLFLISQEGRESSFIKELPRKYLIKVNKAR